MSEIIDNCQYLMEEITMLPDTKTLSLWLSPDGHVFGPYVFYLLCLSTGIRNFKMELSRSSEEQKTCSSGCICNQQEDMETDDLLLNSLMEVEINGLSGAEHEFTFVERLLRGAAMLKTITLSFHHAITVTGEVCQKLLGLSQPKTCMKINYYVNGDEVMYSPAG
ncbi:uncharacterized protein LOC104581686 [Brachypodium distachyon]|uniref:uncharacterized protein LOC104581686 n=1 Tax=Brachypodium distachyon TaxID=15368 RepID=UPI000D0DDDFF|nr:uncharacterized protein LOC104581686 [Brachypodium distachyon]|eukprot:XP_024312734.1 uncharacterized protein LOC104581686 [Brachypodium distachyon]